MPHRWWTTIPQESLQKLLEWYPNFYRWEDEIVVDLDEDSRCAFNLLLRWQKISLRKNNCDIHRRWNVAATEGRVLQDSALKRAVHIEYCSVRLSGVRCIYVGNGERWVACLVSHVNSRKIRLKHGSDAGIFQRIELPLAAHSKAATQLLPVVAEYLRVNLHLAGAQFFWEDEIAARTCEDAEVNGI